MRRNYHLRCESFYSVVRVFCQIMNESMQLAVFPLPIFLLPQGRTRLRIFEPKYIRMVKQSAGADGFVLSLLQRENEYSTSDWGAWVEIIDFETLPDGMLGITVEAKHLVLLSDFYYEQDQLLNAKIEVKSHWNELHNEQYINPVSFKDIQDTYTDLLSQQSQLSELYPQPNCGNLTWLVSRWLEVLPLNAEMRKKLTQQDSFGLALETVETILLGK